MYKRFESLWKDNQRTAESFLVKIKKMPVTYIEFEPTEADPMPSPSPTPERKPRTPRKRGRPVKLFTEESVASKYRHTDSPVSKYSVDQILFSAKRKLRCSGQSKVAQVIDMVMESPTI